MRIALLVTEGTDADKVHTIYRALTDRKASPRIVGSKLGVLQAGRSNAIHVEVSTEIAPSVLWDAVVLVGGDAADKAFANEGELLDFVRDQYHHCKPVIGIGDSDILDAAQVPLHLPGGDPDTGVALLDDVDVDLIVATIAKRRYFDRQKLAERYTR